MNPTTLKETILYKAKKALEDHNKCGANIFYGSEVRYDRNKAYALGNQDQTQYKTLMNIDKEDNVTAMNIDFSIRNIIGKFRDIALSKMSEQTFFITATPVDSLSRHQIDESIAETKAKLKLREIIKAQGMNPDEYPDLALDETDPEDIEELTLRMEIGDQYIRSMDAELIAEDVFLKNDIRDEVEHQLSEDLFDIGVAGFKHEIKDDKVTIRHVNIRNVITSFSTNKYFNGISLAGEIMLLPTKDVIGNFENENDKTIIRNYVSTENAFSSLSTVTNYSQRDYVEVFDFEFIDCDDIVFEKGKHKGNIQISKTKTDNLGKNEKYVGKKVYNVYKGKWIIGTDLVYDFGKKEDMIRSSVPKDAATTELSYQFIAYNFNEMKVESFLDRLIPFADEFQLSILRAQNLKSRIVPDGFSIDIDALQNAAFVRGDKTYGASDLINMFFETGILVMSSKGINGDVQNYKPINEIRNSGTGQNLIALWNDMTNILNQMRSIIGLNDITDGSTPNPRTLNGVASLSHNATNNALSPLFKSRMWLLKRMAEAAIKRGKQVARRSGGYKGFVPAINGLTLKHFEVESKFYLKEFSIGISLRMPDAEQQMLLQSMQNDIAKGYLDSSDVFMIINTYNLKQAQFLLSLKVQRGKERERQQAIQMQEMNGKIQQESAMVAEKAKQDTYNKEYEVKSKLQKEKHEQTMRELELKLRLTNMGQLQRTILKPEDFEETPGEQYYIEGMPDAENEDSSMNYNPLNNQEQYAEPGFDMAQEQVPQF
ncbi:hypothetical protein [Polluticaenibacter yanchengensis]|uniref:Portal protein n=1 Tax=Polluticaenibacter yanchengensis TaxID=3014562 RepID=A0ABT4UIR5_9BACT|nr:hypothetical protein [Chitinophagaceae bacterium LY-5]